MSLYDLVKQKFNDNLFEMRQEREYIAYVRATMEDTSRRLNVVYGAMERIERLQAANQELNAFLTICEAARER